jgi:hypothetical protein
MIKNQYFLEMTLNFPQLTKIQILTLFAHAGNRTNTPKREMLSWYTIFGT